MTMLSTIQLSPMRWFGRKRVILLSARLRRLINAWAAAAIARHERRAALAALRQLDDRELKDIGIYRGQTVFGSKFRHRSPGHYMDGGLSTEILFGRNATKWLRLKGCP